MQDELEWSGLRSESLRHIANSGRYSMIIINEADGPVPTTLMNFESRCTKSINQTDHLSNVPSSLSNHHSSSFKTLAAASSNTTSIKNFLISGISNGK